MDRESLVYKAKLAEQAERFDEMVSDMKEVARQPQELTVEERNLLSVAYKNVIGSRRASWRVVTSIEQKGDPEKMTIIKDYKAKIESELVAICYDILSIIEEYLIPNSTSEEAKVFYYKMKGDYHRHLSDTRKESAGAALHNYKSFSKNYKMNLETIPYTDYENGLPQTGQHILGQVRGDNIIVYQAFHPAIAEYAVTHQKFGGAAYSFSRMSWIKPNFLWMTGWGRNANQERILSIEISLTHFETILAQAVHTSFQPDVYTDRTEWETALRTSNVRLQWDPDHHPSGAKLQRRAMQLGIKGSIRKQFATEWIVSIEDITDFVQAQGRFVAIKDWTKLLVIKESVVPIQNLTMIQTLNQ